MKSSEEGDFGSGSGDSGVAEKPSGRYFKFPVSERSQEWQIH